MNLIDTHSHIYLKEFDDDRAEMLQNAVNEGVTKVFLPAIDAETHEQMLRAETDYPGQCFSMMGVHPCSVKEDYKEEMKLAARYLEQRRFIAIGETGLDFYWDLTYKSLQFKAFEEQIEWALHFDIPVVIHSRNSIDECIKVIRSRQKGNLKGVFHCFSGTEDQARQIMDLDFYMGIGGVATFKNGGLDKVIPAVGLSRVILETDAPYLAPVPFRGKRNEPSYLKYVVEKLEEFCNVSGDIVGEITTENAKGLFGF